MLKKTITYKDYNGQSRTEDFYFNLSKAEVTEMEVSEDSGSLVKTIEKVTAEKNGKEIIRIFKDLILKSYGQKSEDGRQFIKSEKLRTEFSQTEAYVDLFMSLATDANVAAAFVNGILPKMPAEDKNNKS